MGGYDLAQYLLNEWKGKDNKLHRGFIDTNDTYMSLRQDDYVGNAENLRMFNFKRDKNQAYERAQAVINQGLVRWPKSLNIRNEYELEVENPDGTKTATITYSHQAEFSGEIVYIDLLAKTNDLLDFLFYKPLNLSLLPH